MITPMLSNPFRRDATDEAILNDLANFFITIAKKFPSLIKALIKLIPVIWEGISKGLDGAAAYYWLYLIMFNDPKWKAKAEQKNEYIGFYLCLAGFILGVLLHIAKKASSKMEAEQQCHKLVNFLQSLLIDEATKAATTTSYLQYLYKKTNPTFNGITIGLTALLTTIRTFVKYAKHRAKANNKNFNHEVESLQSTFAIDHSSNDCSLDQISLKIASYPFQMFYQNVITEPFDSMSFAWYWINFFQSILQPVSNAASWAMQGVFGVTGVLLNASYLTTKHLDQKYKRAMLEKAKIILEYVRMIFYCFTDSAMGPYIFAQLTLDSLNVFLYRDDDNIPDHVFNSIMGVTAGIYAIAIGSSIYLGVMKIKNRVSEITDTPEEQEGLLENDKKNEEEPFLRNSSLNDNQNSINIVVDSKNHDFQTTQKRGYTSKEEFDQGFSRTNIKSLGDNFSKLANSSTTDKGNEDYFDAFSDWSQQQLN